MAETNKKNRMQNLIAGLIVALSVLTAYALFQSSEVASDSNDNFFRAQGFLTDSNLEYIQIGQDLFYDLNVSDQVFLHEQNNNQEMADYFFNQLTSAAQDSYERPDGPFDEAYYDAVYESVLEIDEQADELFILALLQSRIHVAFQLAVTIFSVGLAFAAWASLMDKGQRTRSLFIVLSSVALVLGILQLVRTLVLE